MASNRALVTMRYSPWSRRRTVAAFNDWVAQCHDVAAGRWVVEWPERAPAQRLHPVDEFVGEPPGVGNNGVVPECVEAVDGPGEPERGGVGERGLLEPAGPTRGAQSERVEGEWLLGAHPARVGRQNVEQVMGDRQQRHAAVARQPLVATGDDDVGSPSGHVDGACACELGGVEDESSAGLVRPAGESGTVNLGAGGVHDRADAHGGDAGVDRLDQGIGEVTVRAVVDPRHDPFWCSGALAASHG